VAKPGDVLEIPGLGMRIELLRTAADTGGELLEYDVVGRPRGFPVQKHVHPEQEERHEVLAGGLRVLLGGETRVLAPGEAVVIPAGAPHRHGPAGTGEGRIRVQLRPPLRTADLLARLAEHDRNGEITRAAGSCGRSPRHG
jgi:quercetin dioxygenase-like cupin family protein